MDYHKAFAQMRANKDKREREGFRFAQQGIDLLGNAVTAYGEQIRPEFLQTIGSAIGGLNSIGALRSGAATTALNDIGTNYADRVGLYAAQTASQGADIGLGVYQSVLQERERVRQKRASQMRLLGSALGAGIGFVTGGPLGAVQGYKVGETITSNGGGMA